MAKEKVTHPGKVGKTGPKKRDPMDNKKQICGPYLTRRKIQELGGMDVLREKLQEFVNKLAND